MKDMWKIFQRWERIKDVFISKRLKVKKQRFEFAKFQGVVNEEGLKRRLSLIWIGTWKLRVNRPRRYEETKKELNNSHKPVLQRKEWRTKDQRQTYAQVRGSKEA